MRYLPSALSRHLKTDVGRNIFWTSIGKASELLFSLGISIAVTRYLGPANYGSVILAITLVGVFNRMVTGGAWLACCSLVAKANTTEEKDRWEDTTRRFLKKRSWIWTGIAILAAALLPRQYGIPMAIAATALPAIAGDSRAWAWQANLQSHKNILADRAGQISGALTQIILLMAGAPTWAFALTAPAADWAKTLVLNQQRKPKRPPPEDLATFERESSGIRLGVVLKYVVGSLPTTAIGFISPTAAGLLAVSQRWTGAASMPAQIYVLSAAPKILASDEWFADGKKAWIHACVLAILPVLCIVLSAHWFIPMLHGKTFIDAIWPTVLLAANIPFFVGVPLLEATLQRTNKTAIQSGWITSALVGAISITMCLVMTPRAAHTTAWLTNAAAAAILITNATTTLCLIRAIAKTRRLKIKKEARKSVECHSWEPAVPKHGNSTLDEVELEGVELEGTGP